MSESIEQLQKENYESRVETLTVLFNKFIEKTKKVDGHTAIVFSTPLCDILCAAVMQLESYEESKRVDDLIYSALFNNYKK